MKKSLGSIIFLTLFISRLIAGDIFDIDYSLSKDSPYVNEEIVLNITLKKKRFKKSATFFDVILPKSDILKFKLLSKDEDTTKHLIKFKYLVKPLKSGRYKIPISIRVKEADIESVNDFTTGSFDEMDFLHTKNSIVKLKPISIDIKDLKQKVDFIGDFKIVSKIDKQNVAQYQPVYINYKIEGKGSYNKIDDLFKDIKGVDKFLQKSGDLEFEYAFSSDKNFTIPSVEILCYSPKKDRYYKLTTPPYKIEVTPINSNQIVDKKDSYPSKAFDISSFLPYIYALIIFMAGYLSKKYEIFDIKRDKKESKDSFKEEISKTKTPKELLKLLLSKDTKRYQKSIEELEQIIYQKGSNSFRSIKERLLK